MKAKLAPALSMIAIMATATSVAASSPSAPTYTVVDRIPGPDGGWDFADVDPAHHRLFIARSDAISVVNLDDRQAKQLATASGGHQVLALADGSQVLETDGKTNRARFIDATTGVVLGEVVTGAKPDAAVIEPVTGLLLVMNAGDGTVSFIDTITRSLVGSLTINGSLEVAAADGHGLVYVNVEDRNEVVVIDARTRSIVRRYPLVGCDGPTGLAIVAGGKRLMSACANNVAVVSDPDTGKVTDRIAIGKGPDGLLYDASRGIALVPTGEGYLEIIAAASTSGIHLIERVATRVSARTAALDARTGRVYLPAADYAAPVAPARRGTQVPGSFQVVVVAPAK